MSFTPEKCLVSQRLIGALGLLLLASCVPTEPEGIHTDGMARIGQQLHARGDDEGAADFYSRSVQHAPNDVTSRKEFGELLEQHGEIERAGEQYACRPQDRTEQTPILLHDYGRVLLKLNHALRKRNSNIKKSCSRMRTIAKP